LLTRKIFLNHTVDTASDNHLKNSLPSCSWKEGI